MNDVNLVMTQVLGFGEKVVMDSYHLQVKHVLPTLRQGEASLDSNSVLLEFFSQKKGAPKWLCISWVYLSLYLSFSLYNYQNCSVSLFFNKKSH